MSIANEIKNSAGNDLRNYPKNTLVAHNFPIVQPMRAWFKVTVAIIYLF